MAKRRRRRIYDIDIEEVSLVDRPANRRPFLFIKRADDSVADGRVDLDKADTKLDLEFSTEGTPGSTSLVVNGKTVDNVAGLFLGYAPIGDEAVSLSCEYSVAAKGESNGGFRGIRTYRLTKNGPEELTRAEWTTKYINDLPDSAFLYIESGGEKDDGGRTKPRSLRHFPYKNKAGRVDLPHLRNAIARIPQSSIPDGKKKGLQAKARKILDKEKPEEKRASDEDMEAIRAFVGGDPAELDADLAAPLAEQIAVMQKYQEAFPAELRGAVVEVVKLATESEAEDDGEDEVADDKDKGKAEGARSDDGASEKEQPDAKQKPEGGTLDMDALVGKITESVSAKFDERIAALESRLPKAEDESSAGGSEEEETEEITEDDLAAMAQEAALEAAEEFSNED